jgi:hypothetical protein
MSIIETAVLSEALCDDLRHMYDDRIGRSRHKDYSGWPVLYWEQLRGDRDRALTIKLIANAVRTIIDVHGHGIHRIETVLMVALGLGGHHSAHADNRRLEGDVWVPNHTPQRSFSAIIYLNGDFEGGEIVFPASHFRVMVYDKSTDLSVNSIDIPDKSRSQVLEAANLQIMFIQLGEHSPTIKQVHDIAAIIDFKVDTLRFYYHLESVGLRIKPTAGLLVAFPSDERYVHQVLPVTAGKRYSLALWFTQDPKHELKM